MQQGPSLVMHFVKVCVILHNLLWQRLGRLNSNQEHENMLSGNHLPYLGRNPTEAAKAQRSVLADDFRNKGAVPWQDLKCGHK